MVRMVILSAVAILCVSACGPTASWVRNPGPDDDGLRYYRPKPYILIAPASMTGEPEHAKVVGTSPYVALYKMSLCYLPDFAEEYSVHIRPGVGASNLNVVLENGWNLTAVNQDLDAKTSDNLDSAAGLVRAFVPGGNGLPSVVAATNGINPNEKAPSGLPEALVRGREVPIGYYEAVVSRNPQDNSKRLAGFRYVGFLPFALGSCDTTPDSLADTPEGKEPIYGLVLEKGMLIFKNICNFGGPPSG